MKTAKALLILILVLGLVFIAGCTQSYSNYDTSTPVPRGGGCGVSMPAEQSGTAQAAANAIPEISSF